MKEIQDTGVVYTQNIDNIAIEERVFFRRAIGMNADTTAYRVATEQEISQREEYERKLNEEFNL